MKLATIVMAAIPLVGSFASLKASDAAGSAPAVIGLVGGSIYTPDFSGGTCVAYVTLAANVDWKTLFATNRFFAGPDPTKVAKETAYLIWVSDFTLQMLPALPPFLPPPKTPQQAPPYGLATVSTGTATLYFSATPNDRIWTNPMDPRTRESWGDPVATFTRNASIARSPDNLASTTMINTVDLVSSKPFTLPGGTVVDLKSLLPHGMTCFEFGEQASSWEVTTCVANGGQ